MRKNMNVFIAHKSQIITHMWVNVDLPMIPKLARYGDGVDS